MASPATTIADEKYVSFTTFKKNGDPVSSAVWIVALPDGDLGFTTGAGSWKVKRLGNDPRATIQASTVRGIVKTGSPVLTGVARVVSGDEAKIIEKAIGRKYNAMFRVIQLGGWIQEKLGRGGAGDAAIRITLDAN